MKIEFSKQGYADLLEQMRKANYKFVRMSEALESSGKRAILRHDVDFSVEYAFEMAELESQKGIVATYFFTKDRVSGLLGMLLAWNMVLLT